MVATTGLATKELDEATWPDYVRFFSQGNGWDHCGCTAYQSFRAPSSIGKWSDRRDWNLALKRSLLERGLTHGILVYSEAEPVGWCQFGPTDELPLPRDQRRALLGGGGAGRDRGVDDRVWRITCFCTLKQFARRGVAGVALPAALKAIRRRGGGLVEASPVALVLESDPRLVALRQWRRGRARLIKAHGRFSAQVERHLSSPPEPVKVQVAGIGEVVGSDWSYGSMHAGSVAMFEREGFVGVASIGTGPRVIMQRTV